MLTKKRILKSATNRIGYSRLTYCCSIILFLLFSSCSSDEEQWNKASKEGTIESYELFLKTYPNSSYSATAKSKLYSLYYGRYLFPITKDRKMGFIDANGNTIINPQYKYAGIFNNGFSLVKVDSLWGIINKKGDIVVSTKYKELSNFAEGLAMIKIDDKWGFVDTTDCVTIKPQYEDAWPFNNDVALVKINNKWGVIDKTGKYVIEPKFDGSYCDENTSHMYYTGEMGEILFIIFTNRNNIKIIKEHTDLLKGLGYQYNIQSWIDDFNEGYARVIINNQWGFVDKNGNTIIKPIYKYCSLFKNGIASVFVKSNTDHAFINTKGETVVLPLHAKITQGLDFTNGLALFENQNNKYGYMDKDGKVVIKPIFDYAHRFSEGLAAVVVKGKLGYIDTNGKMVIQPQFSSAYEYCGGVAKVELENKISYINKEGKSVWSETGNK